MKLFPSILSADFACLVPEIEAIRSAGVPRVHLDVMDGHFVPNLSFGLPVVRSLRERFPDLKMDAHLMIQDPASYLDRFLDLGISWVSVHVETEPDLEDLRRRTDREGVQLGLAFNPDTPVERVLERGDRVDYVVAMTVQPGFGGQSFHRKVLEDVQLLSEAFPGPVQVDGGVGPGTLPAAVRAGADWFVAGSAVFGGEDPRRAVEELRAAADVPSEGEG